MSTKTSWDDMERMGETKRNVFLTLNPLRDNTIPDESHLHLNDFFVAEYGWYCYNKVMGNAVLSGSVPINNITTTTASTTHNPNSITVITVRRVEEFEFSSTASLINKTSALITLGESVTIANIADSGRCLTIGTEATSEVSHKISEKRTVTFEFTVAPGETIALIRSVYELGQTATYQVPYGIQGMIGTVGDRYNGRYHWGFGTENLNSSLSDNYDIEATYTKTNISFSVKSVSGTSPVKSRAVYISPRGPEYNVELDIQDGNTPDAPRSGEAGIPGF